MKSKKKSKNKVKKAKSTKKVIEFKDHQVHEGLPTPFWKAEVSKTRKIKEMWPLEMLQAILRLFSKK